MASISSLVGAREHVASVGRLGHGWGLMLGLRGTVDLANLALVLVLTSSIASLWWPGWASALAAVVAVLAFNWTFVPPGMRSRSIFGNKPFC